MAVSPQERAIALAAAGVRAARRESVQVVLGPDPGDDWRAWLYGLFPAYLKDAFGAFVPFAPRHADLWQWVFSLERGVRPHPFVAIWPRGGAKSTTAEMACAVVAGRQRRRYAVYVCATQDQADDHVSNVASMLESRSYAQTFPQASQRMVGKFGNSRGWRRNRLRTSSGFTLDAIGLDSAARGAKIDEDRPDLMILDDLDELDSNAVVSRKLRTLTHSILPAGAPDMATLAVQNLVHADSIFRRLVDGRADFLADRTISGPFRAIDNLVYATVGGRMTLTSGTPTWAGQDLFRCQQMVNDFGLESFLVECQHEVDDLTGGMYDHIQFKHITRDDLPDLERVVVWLDPAVTSTDQSDSHGIQCDGKANDLLYRLWSWEDRTTPQDAMHRAVRKALEWKAEAVGVETDQGGDTWESVYELTWKRMLESGEISEGTPRPQFRAQKAGAGFGPKAHRGQQMVTSYEQGRIIHMVDDTGSCQLLERALRRFPRFKPYDLADASFWSFFDLMGNRPVAFGSAPPAETWRPGGSGIWGRRW